MSVPAAAPAEGVEHNGQAERARAQGSPGHQPADDDGQRFIRVRADKLDLLIDLIGELVIASSGAQLVAERERSPAFAEATLRMHGLVQEARDGALGLRMVAIGDTFTRLRRTVRDAASELGGQMELQISGGDTELDRTMADALAGPLAQIVRDRVAQGLETPAARTAAGKPPQATLALRAYRESGAVHIEVSDDGPGTPCNPLSPTVRRDIEALRGHVAVAHTPERGTKVQIRLPLTLAIIDGFLTSVSGVSYVLPLERVAECLAVPATCAADGSRVSGQFDLRGEVLPYVDLGRLFGQPAAAVKRRSLVLVRDGGSRIGLVVDRLHGEHQTVIKPLGAAFSRIEGLAGSTVLGSGDVALLLDVPALIRRAVGAGPPTPQPAALR